MKMLMTICSAAPSVQAQISVSSSQAADQHKFLRCFAGTGYGPGAGRVAETQKVKMNCTTALKDACLRLAPALIAVSSMTRIAFPDNRFAV
jgi:hypothetical protein